MEIRNNLHQVRLSRGLSAAELAMAVDVSRQTIYAIESGGYVPNTVISLKLAQILGTSVEELFQLPGDTRQPEHVEQVELVSAGKKLRPGQPVQLCAVDDQLVAAPPELELWTLPSADGVVLHAAEAGRRTQVQVCRESWKDEKRLLLAGCDPGVSVLARHLQRQGIELVLTHHNSSRALQLLKRGVVHMAGTHIRDDKTGQSNLSAITGLFRKDTIAVFSFTLWEEGLVVAPGNPKQIRGVADLTRKDVKITNRDPGAGSRLLLDSLLAKAGISHKMVRGYEQITSGHLPAARLVQRGEVDCCVNTRATARVLGLDFVSLISERYDLVVRRKNLHLPQVEAVLDTLSRAALRRELEGIGGYDMSHAGDRLL
jgi:putative molybdopterin biosynthesis protein